MNQDTQLLQKPFITVGAIFENELGVDEILNPSDTAAHDGFCYTYKAEIDSGLQVGDYAIVHANDELKIVKIVQVHDTPQIDVNAKFEYKWVVQKIDFSAFRQRHDEQKRISELLNALAMVERKNALAERLNQAAKDDKSFAKLFGKIKETLNL